MERFSNVSSSVSEHALLSMGIAILRYRLWNVDILINRTLAYGTLTGILALVYIGSIIALQSLLRGLFNSTSGVAIVISALVIDALFQPLQESAQKAPVMYPGDE